MSNYTTDIIFTTYSKIVPVAKDTVCFIVIVDQAFYANLCGTTSVNLYTNDIKSYSSLVKVSDSICNVHYIMSVSKLLKMTDKYKKSEMQVECTMRFNVQCDVSKERITKINISDVICIL